MNTENQNQNVTAPAVETSETNQVVASVPKVKASAGRPTDFCKFLHGYLQTKHAKVSESDMVCAHTLVGEWVKVKQGTLSPSDVSYTPRPKKVKVAKVKTAESPAPAVN